MRVGFFGYVLIGFGLISCGSSSVAPTQLATGPTSTTPTQVLPECFSEISFLPPQPELATIPLPPTTRITNRFERPHGDLMFVGGVVGDTNQATAFFESQLPKHGFQVTYSDSDFGQSDGSFSNATLSARWHLVAQSHCTEIVTLYIILE